MIEMVAAEILTHAQGGSCLSLCEAKAQARRVLFAEGLGGLLRGAPESLLEAVARYKKERLEILLMQALATKAS